MHAANKACGAETGPRSAAHVDAGEGHQPCSSRRLYCNANRPAMQWARSRTGVRRARRDFTKSARIRGCKNLDTTFLPVFFMQCLQR